MIPSSSFYEDEGSRLLTAAAFDFALDGEIGRAARSQSFLTVVFFEVTRAWDTLTMPADRGALDALSAIIGQDTRETDLLGHTDDATLTLALSDADAECSGRIVERLVSRISSYNFPAPIGVEVGLACDPTHAVDAALLKRYARSHPMVKMSAHVA
jgi:GGDEF domain-containing protein